MGGNHAGEEGWGREGWGKECGGYTHQPLAYPLLVFARISKHAHVAALVVVDARRQLVEQHPGRLPSIREFSRSGEGEGGGQGDREE